MVAPTLSGVHVALATPVDESGALDRDGLLRLIDRVRGAEVSAVCPTGSTGEGPRLTRAQRAEVVAAVREQVRDLRLVAAPAAQTAAEMLDELRGFAGLGADAALVAVPSYFAMDADEVRRYYLALAEASPLPLLLYNIPMMTGAVVPVPVVGELARHPNMLGIKDSSRDFEYFQAVIAATADADDFAVLTGTDTMLFASLVVGGHGTIAASLNVAPRLSTGIETAVRDGDRATAQRLQRQLQDLVGICRTGSPPAGWKAALEYLGVCSRRLVPPASGLDDRRYGVLARRLEAAGVGAGT